MAEEPAFDVTMKKKKKKTAFVLEAEVEDPVEEVNEETQSEKISLDDITSLTKKKKKKKKPFSLAELDDALPKTEDTAEGTDETGETADIGLTPFDLNNLPMKKKKKKKAAFIEESVDDTPDGNANGNSAVVGTVWQQNSELDYTYEELLCRAIEIMREDNPDMVAGQKRRFVMKPPHVLRVGTKKSSFSNFAEICKLLHRQPKHLHQFLMSELGTSGSIDGNNQLIIKGRFQQKQIESVLRRYIKEYVTCHTCRSPETILQKDTRLYFLQCETCGSRCSVVGIKSGFQAVTGKRAAIRARTK